MVRSGGKLPLRLLFLASDFPPAFGGIQKLSFGLCSALGAEGHEVRIVASAQPGDAEFDLRSGVDTVRTPIRGMFHGALAIGGAVRRLARAPRPPDAVVATKWAPEGPAYLWSRQGIRVPLVVMGHGREFLPEPHRRIRGLVQGSVLRAAAGGIANSRFTAARMVAAGMPEGRVHIVRPGIDPEEFGAPVDLDGARSELGWPRGRTLLTIARLVRRKGVDTVIEALPEIAATVPDVHYVVIGDGPEGGRLRALAREQGMAQRVRFLGTTPEAMKRAALRLCDAFVMVSRDIPSEPPEGFGIVYLEANASGKPVMAGRTGGVEDAVEEGVNGVLVPPDSPAELAEAAASLLTDAAMAAKMGESGRRRALERFAWPTVAPQFAAAVRAILADSA